MPGRSHRAKVGVVVGLLIAIVIDTLVQIVWKGAVRHVAADAHGVSVLLDTARQPLAWLLPILFITQFLNWMIVLARADLSYAQPFTTLSYVTTAICSFALFSERITPLRMAGIALILAGVFCISRSERKTSAA